ncbi:MAG: rhodanese-like domain-containing protein [Candidatus Poribacteria bacterium]|nr:rhodanese-like domain-containing protein [Candidatus Poribacteria bacterium]
MRSNTQQSKVELQNNSKHITLRHIAKELLIVCVWIGFGAITLWCADGFGLFPSTSHTLSNPSLQVEFPEVYDIWKRKEAIFVDARSTANFRRGHIPGAVNVPINRILPHIYLLPTDSDTPLITYCGSIYCPNAYQLMEVLLGRGYRNVRLFTRGIKGWQSLGYTLETE